MTEVYLGKPPAYIETWMKENSKQHGEIGRGYWMVRLLPNGEWRKLIPVDDIDALWRDSSTNSYIAGGIVSGKWKVSIDNYKYTSLIPVNSYEKFSDDAGEGYYVFE